MNELYFEVYNAEKVFEENLIDEDAEHLQDPLTILERREECTPY